DGQHLLGPRLRARPGRHGATELAVLRNGVARRRLAPRVPLPQRALPPPRVPDELLPLLGAGGLDGLRARDLPPRPADPAPRLLAARAGGQRPAPQSAPRRRTGPIARCSAFFPEGLEPVPQRAQPSIQPRFRSARPAWPAGSGVMEGWTWRWSCGRASRGVGARVTSTSEIQALRHPFPRLSRYGPRKVDRAPHFRTSASPPSGPPACAA